MVHQHIDKLKEEQDFTEKTLQKGDLVKYYSRSKTGKRGTVVKINKKSIRLKDKKGKISRHRCQQPFSWRSVPLRLAA